MHIAHGSILISTYYVYVSMSIDACRIWNEPRVQVMLCRGRMSSHCDCTFPCTSLAQLSSIHLETFHLQFQSYREVDRGLSFIYKFSVWWTSPTTLKVIFATHDLSKRGNDCELHLNHAGIYISHHSHIQCQLLLYHFIDTALKFTGHSGKGCASSL